MILNRTSGNPRRLLFLAAALLLMLEAGGLIVQRSWAREQFVPLALLHAAVYLVAVLLLQNRRGPHVGLVFILVVAALLRLGPLIGPVIWSSDIYRYVWDGWVQNQGINPYCCLPSDPTLAGLRDEAVYPFINRKDTARTIYPPVAQMVFAAHGWLGGTLFSMKALLLGFEALGIWAMLRLLRRLGRPPQEILIYCWHPLPVWEIAGSGHLDALLVAFVPIALLGAVAGRRLLAGIALGAAVLTKFIPIVLFPAVWRRWDWRMPVACSMFMAACYLPYLGVGTRVLGYLPGYLEEEHLGPGSGTGFWLVDTLHQLSGVLLPSTVYLGLSAAVLLIMGIFASARAAGDRATLRWAMAIGLTTMLLFSPHYAWYFVWVIVLLTLSPWTPGLWPTLTAFLLYWDPIGGRVPTWVGAVIYGGFAVLAIVWLVRAGFHRENTVQRIIQISREGPAGAPAAFRGSSPGGPAGIDPSRYFESVAETRAPIAGNDPVCLYLEVTNRCNLLCETCPRTFEDLESPADMSWELFTRIVDQLPDVARVVMHGVGEPMLVRNLPRMVRYLKDRGTYVLFNTNGTLLTQKKGDELVDAGLDELRVSLDAADRERFKQVRGKDMFERIVKNLRSFILRQRASGSTRPRVSLWLTGLKETIDQLDDFVRLAHGIGVGEVYLQRLVFFQKGQGLAREESALFERLEAVEAGKIETAQKLAESLGLKFDASGATEPGTSLKRSGEDQPWSLCRRPWSLMYFTAHGRALPCCIAPFSVPGYDSFTLGNATVHTLREIWNGPAYAEFRRALLSEQPPVACAGCGMRWSL